MRLANVLIPHWRLGAGLDASLIADIVDKLPDDAYLTAAADDHSRGCLLLRFGSQSFIDVPQAGIIPDILVNFGNDPVKGEYISSLDMSAALAAYQTQGAPVSCTRQGCIPASPCFMCAVNANAATVPGSVGLSPGSSLPTHATPSPWSQVVSVKGSGAITPVGTPPVPINIGFPLDPNLFGIKPAGCSHKWKFYQGLTDNYNYCEYCDEKQK